MEDPGRAALLCRFFDPDAFTIPPESDALVTALEVSPMDAPFDEALASLIDTRFFETVRREQLSLRGAHRTFRLELVATGRGLADRGTRTYGYLVRRLYGPPVFIRTTAEPRQRLRYRDIVDHAWVTLRLFAVPPPQASGLPEPVARTHAAVLDAAERHDVAALGRLVDPVEFSYTFGQPTAGGPAEYFRAHPGAIDRLAQILRLPYTLANGIYVWPFAYDKNLGELTGYERDLLGNLIPHSLETDSGYLGWRAGIRPDGRWVFFVAGD